MEYKVCWTRTTEIPQIAENKYQLYCIVQLFWFKFAFQELKSHYPWQSIDNGKNNTQVRGVAMHRRIFIKQNAFEAMQVRILLNVIYYYQLQKSVTSILFWGM